MNLIKKVMLSNASTPSFGPYAQLESFKLILNTYLKGKGKKTDGASWHTFCFIH